MWNHACFLVQINTDSLPKEKWSIRSDSKNNHYTHYACPQKNPLNMLSRLWIFICIANDSHCRQSVYLDISSSEENELINFIAWRNLQAILFPPFRSKRSYCKFKQCDLEPADMIDIFKQYPKERTRRNKIQNVKAELSQRFTSNIFWGWQFHYHQKYEKVKVAEKHIILHEFQKNVVAATVIYIRISTKHRRLWPKLTTLWFQYKYTTKCLLKNV